MSLSSPLHAAFRSTPTFRTEHVLSIGLVVLQFLPNSRVLDSVLVTRPGNFTVLFNSNLCLVSPRARSQHGDIA